MQNPKLLVLGARGRIGGILRKCRPFGQVVWQARRGSGVRPGPGWAMFDPLAAPEALARAASGACAILCLAGVVPGRGGRGGGDLRDNIRLGEAAVRAGAGAGARVFLASSAAVYGNRAGVLTEDMALTPVSDYGRAKAEMEARGAALGAELGVRVCALRIGNIAGIDAILGGWHPGFQLDRFADGRTPSRSYIGARSLARVLGDLMRADEVPQALNIAAPGMVEMGALLDAAGLAWAPRAPSRGAIPEVCLSTRALQRISPLARVDAAALVAEWEAVQGLE